MYWHNTVPLTQSTCKDSDNHTACLADIFPKVNVTLTDDTIVVPSDIPYLSTKAISVQVFARNTAPYVKTATEVSFRNYEVWPNSC
jgi:HSP20 family molecular chaperone IbpA